ncbi:hypothetical protein GW17_00017934 [Ensete ventricosum]|nr:hypothetical protein GW17_00017934 [Ensete ventricosum]
MTLRHRQCFLPQCNKNRATSASYVATVRPPLHATEVPSLPSTSPQPLFIAAIRPPLLATEVSSLPTPSPLLPPTTSNHVVALPYHRYSSTIFAVYLFHLSCGGEDCCPQRRYGRSFSHRKQRWAAHCLSYHRCCVPSKSIDAFSDLPKYTAICQCSPSSAPAHHLDYFRGLLSPLAMTSSTTSAIAAFDAGSPCLVVVT